MQPHNARFAAGLSERTQACSIWLAAALLAEIPAIAVAHKKFFICCLNPDGPGCCLVTPTWFASAATMPETGIYFKSQDCRPQPSPGKVQELAPVGGEIRHCFEIYAGSTCLTFGHLVSASSTRFMQPFEYYKLFRHIGAVTRKTCLKRQSRP